jgi:hypothetical protein
VHLDHDGFGLDQSKAAHTFPHPALDGSSCGESLHRATIAAWPWVKEPVDEEPRPHKPAETHGLGVEETHGRRVLDGRYRAGHQKAQARA